MLFLKLVRWKNLSILLFCQLLFKYFVFPFFNTTSLLTIFEFTLLLISTIFIAAGGYVINDIFDVDCDLINKPKQSFIPSKISIKTAKKSYWILSSIGIILGILLSFQRDLPYYSFLFLGIVSLLYFYSSHLKKIAFIGNLTIAILVSSCLLVFALFDTTLLDNSMGIYYLWVFTFFSFCINLLREIIKDIEDIKGDYNTGMKTLPIVLGVERTKKAILILSLVPLYFSIHFLTTDLKNNSWAQVYFSIFILIPLFYFIYKTHNSTKSKEFKQLSKLLKWILIFGLLLIFLITT
jgi:4-hydroxybenzoate polyprenyltransferase